MRCTFCNRVFRQTLACEGIIGYEKNYDIKNKIYCNAMVCKECVTRWVKYNEDGEFKLQLLCPVCNDKKSKDITSNLFPTAAAAHRQHEATIRKQSALIRRSLFKIVN